MNPDIDMHQKVRLLIQLSVLLDEKLDAIPQECHTTPRDMRLDLLDTCHTFLCLWNEMQAFFVNNEDAQDNELFHITIKTHFLLHCCLDRSNPKKMWCFRGEDLMARMRKLAFSCAKRSQSWQVGNKAIGKYCVALDLLFKSLDAVAV